MISYRDSINRLIDKYVNYVLTFESDVFSASKLKLTTEQAEQIIYNYLLEYNIEQNINKYDLVSYYDDI